jgi:DNA polymerase-3 subunit chi
MTTVLFYHLTRSPAANTLRAILPRAMQASWRVLIRADAPVLAQLDNRLWEGEATSFIPHALAGSGQDADQPILLGNLASQGFDALALVGISALDLAEIPHLNRVWVLFDASDPAQIDAARAQWKTVSDAKFHAQYWSEDGGRWAMKTAANAPVQ